MKGAHGARPYKEEENKKGAHEARPYMGQNRAFGLLGRGAEDLDLAVSSRDVGARLDRARFGRTMPGMESARRRATERLHGGRVSVLAATYFVTFVTGTRTKWLATPAATAAMRSALRDWHNEKDGSILAATVMPDHVHVLFMLGQRLDVGRCVSRWKAVGRKSAGYAGDWQRDFWEHRVRERAEEEDYALYIYLNPYRAGLTSRMSAWSGWWAPAPMRFRFTGLLGPEGEPPAEWVSWPDERFAGLKTGE